MANQQPTLIPIGDLIEQATALAGALASSTHPEAHGWATTVSGVVESMKTTQAADAAAYYAKKQQQNPMTTQSGKGVTPSGIPRTGPNPGDPQNGV